MCNYLDDPYTIIYYILLISASLMTGTTIYCYNVDHHCYIDIQIVNITITISGLLTFILVMILIFIWRYNKKCNQSYEVISNV